MLATANSVPDLPVISNSTNVIGDIGRQSLRVASLIHEYTKLSIAGDLLLYLLLNFKPKDSFIHRSDCGNSNRRFKIPY